MEIFASSKLKNGLYFPNYMLIWTLNNGLKLWISNTEICIDNCNSLINDSHITQLNKIKERESNRKLPRMFPVKNLW